jgi:hypothetical protein
MAHIHIDSDSLQGSQHLASQVKGYGRSRLSSFIQIIENLGHSIEFGTIDSSKSGWKNADLLIIPTRRPNCGVDATLPDIEQFVSKGGSLFLLSNHSRVPAFPSMGNFTQEDGKITRRFGIELAEVCFCTDAEGTLTRIDDARSNTHPILLGSSGARVVNSVVVNNGSAIRQNSVGEAVLWWPTNVVDIGPNSMSPDEMAFCWAAETKCGRVLVVGDSGFIGEPKIQGSGPGLFNQGENSLFIQQAIGWLLEI